MCDESTEFTRMLRRLIAVGMPITKLIACVESNEISPEYVFLIWHAAVKATSNVLEDVRMGFPPDVKSQVYGILSFRHAELFGPGDMGSMIYLACAYLNPS